MHEETRALLRTGVLASLPILQAVLGKYQIQYLCWKKTGEGRWQGEHELRPDMRSTFRAVEKEIDKNGEGFAASFLTRYPDHCGMVGFGGCQFNMGGRVSEFFSSILGYVWRKHERFDINAADVELALDDFCAFVDSPSISFRFWSQLLNFRMNGDEIVIPKGLRIRRLSEEEVSAVNGGDISNLGFVRPRLFGIEEFIIEGHLDQPKLLGSDYPEATSVLETVQPLLNRAILALRTFKSGHVGYDYVHFTPVGFCPFPLGSYGCGDLHVPFGTYQILDEELAGLLQHAPLVFSCTEGAMEMACSRLADAETRTRVQDRIVDAVIGMEALLLSGLHSEDRKGELKFRFSMNYSTLFDSATDRHKGFRVATDLYDLRSVIAHGGTPSEPVRVGSEKVKLQEASKRAVESLRFVVQKFLPRASEAPYKKPEFWENAYFHVTNGNVPIVDRSGGDERVAN